VEIEFEVGNFHELVKDAKKSNDGKNVNKHRWTGFIRIKDPKNRKYISKLVDKVRFHLHETFRVPHYEAKSTPGCLVI